jgi:hypothetical protein
LTRGIWEERFMVAPDPGTTGGANWTKEPEALLYEVTGTLVLMAPCTPGAYFRSSTVDWVLVNTVTVTEAEATDVPWDIRFALVTILSPKLSAPAWSGSSETAINMNRNRIVRAIPFTGQTTAAGLDTGLPGPCSTAMGPKRALQMLCIRFAIMLLCNSYLMVAL